MDIIKYKFNQCGGSKGELVFLEGNRDIDFNIKRVYYIYNVPKEDRRGFHAHKKIQQILITIHGSCKIHLDNGSETKEVILNNPQEGLFVGTSMWHEMYDFSTDCVLLVLASEFYDESDYIRDYDDFLNYIKNSKKNLICC